MDERLRNLMHLAREHYDEEAILGLAYSEYLKAPHDAAAVA
jgi:hypothetical protein